MDSNNIKYVTNWLYTCAALVFAMVIIGAITRLTESGLSIVEWRPLIGSLPPMNETEWNRVFDLYQQTPEFQKKNFWMELEQFKSIFFWEWFHRFLGTINRPSLCLTTHIFLAQKLATSRIKTQTLRPLHSRRLPRLSRMVDGQKRPHRSTRSIPFPPRCSPINGPLTLFLFNLDGPHHLTQNHNIKQSTQSS